MELLLSIDLYFYIMLFIIAGFIGFIVRIDQWVEGIYTHPINKSGTLDLWRSFIGYILIFIFSGLAGAITSVASGYILEHNDLNIYIFVAITIGAIGKLIFYKLVYFVHEKFDNNIGDKKYKRSSEKRRDTK